VHICVNSSNEGKNQSFFPPPVNDWASAAAEVAGFEFPWLIIASVFLYPQPKPVAVAVSPPLPIVVTLSYLTGLACAQVRLAELAVSESKLASPSAGGAASR
jgi:hypothetical protein